MGCCSCKSVRCARCNRSLSGSNSHLDRTNNICLRCQQEQDYLQILAGRLAALRDDSIPATGTVRSTVHPVAPARTQPSIRVQRPATVTGPPRYTISSRKTTTTRGKKSIHCPATTKPLFGEYKCPKCRNVWSSRRSWRGMYQKCQKCGEHTYAYSQRELRKSDMTENRPHQEHLCQKCIQLGYNCSHFKKRVMNIT